MVEKDVYYQVILDGLARYVDSPFMLDIARAVVRFPDSRFHVALNKNQMACKKWLIEELYQTRGARLGTVYILGGWYGILAAMLLDDDRFEIDCVVSFDIDPACKEIAESVNHTHLAASRFKAVTSDVGQIDYHHAAGGAVGGNGAGGGPDIVINTSCEHMDGANGWYKRIPSGVVQILQSNDQFECEEHINCVPDVGSFRRQMPMEEVWFEGALERKRYTRFMLIGRK